MAKDLACMQRMHDTGGQETHIEPEKTEGDFSLTTRRGFQVPCGSRISKKHPHHSALLGQVLVW